MQVQRTETLCRGALHLSAFDVCCYKGFAAMRLAMQFANRPLMNT
jgi:hypothetical protein